MIINYGYDSELRATEASRLSQTRKLISNHTNPVIIAD